MVYWKPLLWQTNIPPVTCTCETIFFFCIIKSKKKSRNHTFCQALTTLLVVVFFSEFFLKQGSFVFGMIKSRPLPLNFYFQLTFQTFTKEI